MSIINSDDDLLSWADGLKPLTQPTVTSKIAGYKPRTKTSGNPKFDSLYDEVGKVHDIDPDLLIAQGGQESSFKTGAISPKGAKGIAQFMPDTAAEFGVNVNDPKSSIDGQARLMRKLLDRTNDIELGLAGYNSGHNASIERLKRNRDRIPETRDYVKKITSNYKRVDAPDIDPDAIWGDIGSLLNESVNPDAVWSGIEQEVVPQPVPESPDTIAAQMQAAADPNVKNRAAVLTTSPEQNALFGNTLGFIGVPVKEGTLWVNGAKARRLKLRTPKDIQLFVEKNPDAMTRLIGKVENVGTATGAGQPAVVTVAPNGSELSSSVVTNPESAQAQMAVDQASFPGAQTGMATTDDVITMRAEQVIPPDSAPAQYPSQPMQGMPLNDPRALGVKGQFVEQPVLTQTKQPLAQPPVQRDVNALTDIGKATALEVPYEDYTEAQKEQARQEEVGRKKAQQFTQAKIQAKAQGTPSYTFEKTGKLTIPAAAVGEEDVTFTYDKAGQNGVRDGEYRLIAPDGDLYIFADGKFVNEADSQVLKSIPIPLPEKGSMSTEQAKISQTEVIADAVAQDYPNIPRQDVVDYFQYYGMTDWENKQELTPDRYFSTPFTNPVTGLSETPKTDTFNLTQRDINLMEAFSKQRAEQAKELEAAAEPLKEAERQGFSESNITAFINKILDDPSLLMSARSVLPTDEEYEQAVNETVAQKIKEAGSVDKALAIQKQYEQMSALEKTGRHIGDFANSVQRSPALFVKTMAWAEDAVDYLRNYGVYFTLTTKDFLQGADWILNKTLGTQAPQRKAADVPKMVATLVEAAYPDDPTTAQSIMGKFARAGGTTVPFMVGAMATGGGLGMTALLGAGMQVGEQYSQAEKDGLSREKQLLSGALGWPIGASEALGLKFGKLGELIQKKSGGVFVKSFMNWLKETGKEMTEESLQEFFQSASSDLVRQGLKNNKLTLKDVARALGKSVEPAAIGGVIGAMFGGGVPLIAEASGSATKADTTALLKQEGDIFRTPPKDVKAEVAVATEPEPAKSTVAKAVEKPVEKEVKVEPEVQAASDAETEVQPRKKVQGFKVGEYKGGEKVIEPTSGDVSPQVETDVPAKQPSRVDAEVETKNAQIEARFQKDRRDWIDKERETNPEFAPDIESAKELLSPEEQKEVKEYEDLRYRSVALDDKYRPYKLTAQEQERLQDLEVKYRDMYFATPSESGGRPTASEIEESVAKKADTRFWTFNKTRSGQKTGAIAQIYHVKKTDKAWNVTIRNTDTKEKTFKRFTTLPALTKFVQQELLLSPKSPQVEAKQAESVDAAPAAKGDAQGKEPWQMSADEFAKDATVTRGNNYISVRTPYDNTSFVIRTLETSKYTDADAIAKAHQDYISKAREQGKSVEPRSPKTDADVVPSVKAKATVRAAKAIAIPRSAAKRYAYAEEVADQIATPEFKAMEAKSAAETPSARTGFTKTQTEWLATKLREHVYEELSKQGFGSAEGITPQQHLAKMKDNPLAVSIIGNIGDVTEAIAVPDDGVIRIKSVAAANRLHQIITGQPIEGIEKAKNATIPRTNLDKWNAESRKPKFGKTSEAELDKIRKQEQDADEARAKGISSEAVQTAEAADVPLSNIFKPTPEEQKLHRQNRLSDWDVSETSSGEFVITGTPRYVQNGATKEYVRALESAETRRQAEIERKAEEDRVEAIVRERNHSNPRLDNIDITLMSAKDWEAAIDTYVDRSMKSGRASRDSFARLVLRRAAKNDETLKTASPAALKADLRDYFRQWYEPTNAGDAEVANRGTEAQDSPLRSIFPTATSNEIAALEASGVEVEREANFKKWFGDSKVVDANGNPLRVYRGDVESKQGIFFTSSTDTAEGYTRRTFFRGGNAPQTTAAYLSLQNPLIIDALGKRNDNIPVPWSEWKPKVFGNLPDTAVSVEDAYAYALKNGHDGLIVKNVVDTADPTERAKPSDVYAVKSQDQVRSAFFPDEPSILRSINASIESPASQEAINRVSSEKGKGLSRVVVDTRSRQERPLIGVDAVDYRPRPYESVEFRGGGRNGDVIDQGDRVSPAYSPPQEPLRMTAWHGSPHKFDKFDSSKIGTGEGAQAYGHGLYFTDKESVAQYYRDALTRNKQKNVRAYFDGEPITTKFLRKFSERRNAGESAVDFPEIAIFTRYGNWVERNDISGLKQRLERDIELEQRFEKEGRHPLGGYFPGSKADVPYFERLLKWVEDNESKFTETGRAGAKYRVDLKPAADEYLLWDKPLSEQSEKVKKAFEPIIQQWKADANHPDSTRRTFPKWLEDVEKGTVSGSAMYRGASKGGNGLADSQREASNYLKSLGIRGIKYLDGSSRGKGEGSYNYVIFDDADVEITEVLFKIRDASDVNALYNVLPYIEDSGELLEFSDGGTIKDGELELSPYDAEVARRLLGEVLTGRDLPASEGAVYNASTLMQMAKVARAKVTELKANGYPKAYIDNLNKLGKNLQKMAANAHGIVYTFDESLPEERFHLEDLSAGRTSTKAIETMKASPLWDGSERFNREYGTLTDADKASEIVAKLATGQEKFYGWDKIKDFAQERAKLFDTWIDGVIDKNNITDIDAFNKEFTRLGAVYAEAKANKETDGTGSVSDSIEQSKEKPPEAEESPGVQGDAVQETEAKQTNGVKQKDRQFAVSMALAGLDIGDVKYDPQTFKGELAKAYDHLDRTGVDKAIDDWAKTIDPAQKMALGTVIAYELKAQNRIPDLIAFGRQLSENSGSHGAGLVFSKLMTRLSPAFAQIEADKRTRKGQKRPATPEELKKIDDLSTKLEESNNKYALATAALEEADARLEQADKQIERLNKALETEKSPPTKEDLQKRLQKAQGQASYYKSLVEERRKTQAKHQRQSEELKQIEADKDDLLEQIGNIFKVSTSDVLFMTAPPEPDLDIPGAEALVKLSALKLNKGIARGLTPEAFDNWLKQLTNNQLSQNDIETIHALAMNKLTGDKTPMTPEAKAKVQNRVAHVRRAYNNLHDVEAEQEQRRIESLDKQIEKLEKADIKEVGKVVVETSEEITERKEKLKELRRQRKEILESRRGETNKYDDLAKTMIGLGHQLGTSPEGMFLGAAMRATKDPRALQHTFKQFYPDSNFNKALVEGHKLLQAAEDTIKAQKADTEHGRKLTTQERRHIEWNQKRARNEQRLGTRALEAELKQLERKPIIKVGMGVLDVWNGVRAVMYSVDAGAALAPGFLTLATSPTTWIRSLRDAGTAFEAKTLNRFLHKKGVLAEDKGVSSYIREAIPGFDKLLRKLGMNNTSFEQMVTKHWDEPVRARAESQGLKLEEIGSKRDWNEGRMSNIAEAIPIVGHSNRFHGLATDLMRKGHAQRFINTLDKLENAGKITAEDRMAAEDFLMRKWANVITGKGYLGMVEPAAWAASQGMSAPRFMASAFQVPYYANPIRIAMMPKGARRIVAADAAKIYGVVGLLTALFGALGWINLDPEDKDFLTLNANKIPGVKNIVPDMKVKPVRWLQEPIRLTAGLLMKYAYYVAKGDTDSQTRIEKEWYDELVASDFGGIGNFWKGRLHPSIGIIKTNVTGKNFVGEPVGWEDVGEYLPLPLTIGEGIRTATYDKKQSILKTGDMGSKGLSDNWARVLATMTLNGVGFGVSSYPGAEPTVAGKQAVSMMTGDDRTEKEKEQSQKANQLERLVRDGYDINTELQNALASDKITEKQAKALADIIADEIGTVEKRFGIQFKPYEKELLMQNRRAFKLLDYLWGGEPFKLSREKIDKTLKFATRSDNWLNDRAAQAEAEAVLLRALLRSKKTSKPKK